MLKFKCSTVLLKVLLSIMLFTLFKNHNKGVLVRASEATKHEACMDSINGTLKHCTKVAYTLDSFMDNTDFSSGKKLCCFISLFTQCIRTDRYNVDEDAICVAYEARVIQNSLSQYFKNDCDKPKYRCGSAALQTSPSVLLLTLPFLTVLLPFLYFKMFM